MRVRISNLESYLLLAIRERERVEKEQGNTGETAFLSVAKETLEAIRRGEPIYLVSE